MHNHNESPASDQEQTSAGRFFRSRTGIALALFLSIAAFFLITEHTAHVFGVLPYLLLLACPFLHLFTHGGHGGSEQGEHADHGAKTAEGPKR